MHGEFRFAERFLSHVILTVEIKKFRVGCKQHAGKLPCHHRVRTVDVHASLLKVDVAGVFVDFFSDGKADHFAVYAKHSAEQAQCFKRQGIPLRNDGLGEALGAGISGGYSLILRPWLNLDFGIGGWGGRQWMYDGSRKWFAEPEAMVGVMFVF